MIKDLNQCVGSCLDCIKNYKTKHNLKVGQDYQVKCSGIPKDYVPESLLESFRPEQRGMLNAMLDPVLWASENLDWHCLDPDGEIWKRRNPEEYYDWVRSNPGKDILGHSRYHRPYQSSMLRCTSNRKVFRIGRQCITGDAYLHLDDGKLVQLKDVKVGNETLSLHENNRLISNKISNFVNQGEKQTFVIKTKFGHTIQCTEDHEFYCITDNVDKYHDITTDKLSRKWLSIKDGLKKGNKIACPEFIDSFGDKPIGDLAVFLGYFLTDGSCSINQSAKFTNTNIDYLNEFAEFSKSLGTNVKWYAKGNGYDLIISNGHKNINPVRELLTKLKLTNITGPEKHIPDCIFTAPKEEIKLFINRFWAGDGYISTFKRTGRNTYRTEIGTLQESRLMLEQLQQLLYRFGCHGYISTEGNCYRYVISNKISVQNFLQEIGPIFGKEESCQRAQDNLRKMSDCFVNRTEDVLWDYISSIEKATIETVYDIEVDGNHNFVANGLISHNCGKTETLVISMLFNMFTQPNVPKDEGFKIIVITPYQSQIDLIFTRMKELIGTSSILQNSVKRSIKAPTYTLELYNGSAVRGFTAGTKSGGNAASVRGQAANMLVFDEADYLNAGDMDAAMAIITNFPNATLWMSSTPSGKREMFFNNCHSRRYKEFHFPSSLNPLWSEDLEADFKETYTELGYVHEVEAEFGEQEQGVFQNVYIQIAKKDYRYGDIPPRHSWTYTMGVDWNDTKNGTTINMLGFDPVRSEFIIVDRKVVSREGWTQLSAIKKIVELNRIWKPLAIYVDKGFGGTQVELLREFGGNALIDPEKGPGHPDAALRSIVKPYDFGSSIEITDPFTKELVKKNAKGYLVETTVRRFEAGDIKFSEYDENLEAQLNGYIIDRVTPTGNAVYKANNESVGDHALDALMLSIMAIDREVGNFSKPKYSTEIAFSGRMGEKVGIDEVPKGSILIKSDRKTNLAEQRDKTKPVSRSVEEPSIFDNPRQLPANNTDLNKPGLWSWDGFMRDEPRPRSLTIGEAAEKAKRRLGLSPMKGSRPRRKNI